jgi:hypothetical protein
VHLIDLPQQKEHDVGQNPVPDAFQRQRSDVVPFVSGNLSFLEMTRKKEKNTRDPENMYKSQEEAYNVSGSFQTAFFQNR